MPVGAQRGSEFQFLPPGGFVLGGGGLFVAAGLEFGVLESPAFHLFVRCSIGKERDDAPRAVPRERFPLSDELLVHLPR